MSVYIRRRKCYRDKIKFTTLLSTLHPSWRKYIEVFLDLEYGIQVLAFAFLITHNFILCSVFLSPYTASDTQCWHLTSENLTQLQLLVKPQVYTLQKSHEISHRRVVKLVQKWNYLRSQVSLQWTEKWRDRINILARLACVWFST